MDNITNSNSKENNTFSKIFSRLPFDIIRKILLFNNHYIERKGKIICIHKIPKNDIRYTILEQKQLIRKLRTNSFGLGMNSWGVWMNNNNKQYTLEYTLTFNNEWEYNFITYEIDKPLRLINHCPAHIETYIIK